MKKEGRIMNLAALLHRPESEDCFLYTDEAMRVDFTRHVPMLRR